VGIVATEDREIVGLALTSERLADAAIVTTAESEPRIVFANAAFARLTDHPREDLRGRTLGFLQRPADFHIALANLCREIDTTGSFFVETTIRRRDGRGIIVEWQTTPVMGQGSGARHYLFSIVHDLSRHRKEHSTLVHEREKARVALGAVGDAVICVDATSRIEDMNGVAEALAGCTASAAHGMPSDDVFRIVNVAESETVIDPIMACIARGNAVRPEGRLLLIGRNGRKTAIEACANPLRTVDGEVCGAVLVCREASDRRATRRLRAGATHDALTGLINRREFERRLDNAVVSARQYGRCQVLCYIDLDHFRRINEAVGHTVGDSVLRQVAGLLHARFRERDTLARLGGDEFGLLLDNCTLDEAERIAETTVASFAATRFAGIEAQAMTVTPSFGLVEVTPYSGSAQQLLSQGDVACYTAKELGRGRSHIYRSDRTAAGDGSPVVLFPQEFRAALEEDRFQLYYQPIVPLQKGSRLPVHYEFLLRHRCDSGQLVMPRALIAAAERHGLMAAVDRWVIRAALRLLGRRDARFADAAIAINLSGNSLDDPGLVDYVTAQFDQSPIAPRTVCFEITETEAIRDLAHAAHVAHGLKKLGCSIALDDFGSGQSSFTYLKALPADYLKIDGSFVRQIIDSPVDRAVVSAIHETGRIMGLKTIAEFAHSQAIIECLRDLGVDYAQGDAVAPPRPAPATGVEDAATGTVRPAALPASSRAQ
jgi:diguanylate cyclase (GGDEF)-like protein/PAS domain S-box-containing protein